MVAKIRFRFRRPDTSRESALESGHIRLEQLKDDYRRRLESGDLSYTERRP